jgi:hypothetical protein
MNAASTSYPQGGLGRRAGITCHGNIADRKSIRGRDWPALLLKIGGPAG